MMKTPRILISINTAWNIVNFRSGLIRALQNAGFDVICAAPPGEPAEEIRRMGCRFVPLAIDNKGTSPVRDLLLLFHYWRLFRRERPDVFLGYTIKPNIYGSLASALCRIPAINNISGLGTAFIEQNWITAVVRFLYRIALRRSAAVFFQNEDDKALFLQMKIVKPEQAIVIPGSGIDLSRFKPHEPADNDRPVFLMIARLLWDKGVGEFVEAARIIKEKGMQARFQLLGFLDVENRTAVTRSEVDAWVKQGWVEYLGDTDDVRPFIQAADCIVLPSYREGTPRSLLEGAAMGKPLITTDVPGCREVVADGVNGFLCRVRSAEDLAIRMEYFCALSSAETEKMQLASRRVAEGKFDEKIVVGAYLKAIDEARQRRAHK